jgi:plasmid stabilization system protein ParE
MSKYKILYTPASVEQIKHITKWYSGINKNLGNRFKENLKTVIESLKTNPFTNSYRYDEVRFTVIHKFPYAAHYTVDKEKFLIRVHAVFAFKENPEKWLRDL